jgi:transcriptional regulator with GAF, ATPase, and Fis domain
LYKGACFYETSQQLPLRRAVIQTFGIKAFIAVPIVLESRETFYFHFYCRDEHAFANEHLNLLKKLEPILSKFVKTNFSDHSYTSPVIPAVKDDIQQPKGFESMIGTCTKIANVYGYISKVAPSETSVLVLGESGTGKEKVAQSIHKLSSRKDKPFVVINCGAIPGNLAESLLFGHEKGAFTGALERRTGKFEQAEGGTIFLDEIGEMPMEMQVKLLRVLQEKEIERVGGKSPIKINVRIIAATNKNLEECVAAGRFRLDLYYRLHVFPITIPPLRERKEDIIELAQHFIALSCQGSGCPVLTLSDFAIEQLMGYDWPGNIRELEHIIYRSILLTEGPVLEEIYLAQCNIKTENSQPNAFTIKTIHENERDYISFILKRCKGKVSGIGGAAELLDIPVSTLNSKIKKLGIKSSH